MQLPCCAALCILAGGLGMAFMSRCVQADLCVWPACLDFFQVQAGSCLLSLPALI